MNMRRKSHRKSREGCLQCKERHVKCNEVHPQCRNCQRLNIACSFSSPNLAGMPLDEDSLADLELLEYWHRHPVTAEASGPARHARHDVVRLGFSHHYLLNSILSLAALRLFDQDRSRVKWYVRAVAHQHAAIARARPHFHRLEESQHQAFLGFATFTSLYSAAEPVLRPSRSDSGQPGFDPVRELLHAIRLARCTIAFVQRHLGSLAPSNPLFLAKSGRSQLASAHGTGLRSPQLAHLRGTIERQCAGENERAACLGAAESLFAAISMLAVDPENPRQTKVVWDWANEVDSTFLDMCSARHPVALVILAYFAVLMNLQRGLWVLQRWPAALLRHIRALLGSEWEGILQWPMEMVFGSPKP